MESRHDSENAERILASIQRFRLLVRLIMHLLFVTCIHLTLQYSV